MDLQNLNLDLFLIRHAEPAFLSGHWVHPQTPLSKHGVQRAKILGLALRRYSLDSLISSPLKRARQTASIICKENPSLPPLHDPQEHLWCSEIDLGELGGMSEHDVLRKYPVEYHPPQRWWEFPSSLVFRLLITRKDYKFPGGESIEEFWNRVEIGFTRFFDSHIHFDKEKIGIVAHGGPFTVIFLLLLGKKFEDENYPGFFIHMADFSFIRIKDQQVVFLQSNPLSHPK
ncbi:MAG: histidine phosphatase family protein [Candidatus Heimdallarchaeota archaeon]